MADRGPEDERILPMTAKRHGTSSSAIGGLGMEPPILDLVADNTSTPLAPEWHEREEATPTARGKGTKQVGEPTKFSSTAGDARQLPPHAAFYLPYDRSPRKTPTKREPPSPRLKAAAEKLGPSKDLGESGREYAVKAVFERDQQRVAVDSDDSIPWPAEVTGDAEKLLRRFDLDPEYGPCCGLTRLERWERAEQLSLHPPIAVLSALEGHQQKLSVLDQHQRF